MQRLPSARLRPFVALLWARPATPPAHARLPALEHVLPTTMAHVAIRLGETPLRLYGSDGGVTEAGAAVIAGVRDRFYAKEAATDASVGALLRPGAARALFGVGAWELAGRHLPMGDLLGPGVERLRWQLLDESCLHRRTDLLEAFLLAGLASTSRLHPAVGAALADLAGGADVGTLVARSGYSHRHLGVLFADAVGMGPARFRRLSRFQRVLELHHANPASPWAQVALEAGYADQAHLARDFRQVTGVRPQAYRRAAPANPHHLPVAAPADRSDPFKTPSLRRVQCAFASTTG